MNASCALVVSATLLVASCSPSAPRQAPGARAADSTLGAVETTPDAILQTDMRIAQSDCHTEFAPDDLAGFVQEWFGVVAGLQLSVDAHPIRQFLRDPEGRHIDELQAVQQCGAAAIAPFRQSRDPAVRELARSLESILAEAMDREKRSAALFRATDWPSFGSLESQSRHWNEIRIATQDLSERTAKLNERIAGVLREDGQPTLGPGRLRITRKEREVALRYRFRFADLTLLVEYRVDPAGPLSFSARNVLKWLYHGRGLTYRDSPAATS